MARAPGLGPGNFAGSSPVIPTKISPGGQMVKSPYMVREVPNRSFPAVRSNGFAIHRRYGNENKHRSGGIRDAKG